MAEGGPVTEIAYLPLKDGVDVYDPSNWAHQTWLELMTTLSEQPGFIRLYHGKEMENPRILDAFIDWTSLSAHVDFMNNTPFYQPFVEKISTLLSAPLVLYHFSVLSSSPSTPSPTHNMCTSGASIEIAHFYNIASPDKYLPNVGKFISNLATGKAAGFAGQAFVGQVVEEIAPRGDTEGKKGTTMMLCIAWTSREEHMQFREGEAFKRDIHLLQDGRESVQMWHVDFDAFPVKK